MILIAGKGHEQGQYVAGTVIPFDDRQVASQALLLRRASEDATIAGGPAAAGWSSGGQGDDDPIDFPEGV